MTAPHPEDTCRRCRGPNVSWHAPSPLWNQVMRGGDINGDDLFGGIVCPTCFAVLAEQAGIASGWTLRADQVHVELQTVTPSGRVWDEAGQLWQEPPAAVQCVGFQWIGQPMTSCDDCGRPAWDHDGWAVPERQPTNPFDDVPMVLRPWEPSQREAVRRRWEAVPA